MHYATQVMTTFKQSTSVGTSVRGLYILRTLLELLPDLHIKNFYGKEDIAPKAGGRFTSVPPV